MNMQWFHVFTFIRLIYKPSIGHVRLVVLFVAAAFVRAFVREENRRNARSKRSARGASIVFSGVARGCYNRHRQLHPPLVERSTNQNPAMVLEVQRKTFTIIFPTYSTVQPKKRPNEVPRIHPSYPATDFDPRK